MTSLTLVLTVASVFLAVALGAGLATSMILSTTSAERRRLFASTRAPELAPLPEVLSLSSGESDSWQQATQMLGRSRKDYTRLKTRLARAGFRQSAAPFIYTLIEYVGPVVLAGAAYSSFKPPLAYFAMAVGAGMMFFLPGLILENRLNAKRREIENGLPDALDLMVVCIEAGSGLDQALVKTSDELAIAYPVLAEELRIVVAEIRAGKPRLEAFKALAQRTKVDDVRALVAMLIQTDRFGTSVGQALRTHADVSRTKRRQRAEERAQKLGVKLVFPLVLCFFPAFYVVVIGPAVVQFIRVFMHK